MENNTLYLADVFNTIYDDVDAHLASGDYLDVGEEYAEGIAETASGIRQIFDVSPENHNFSFKYFEDGARCVVDALTVSIELVRKHIHLSQIVAAVCKFEGGEYYPVETKHVLGISIPEDLFIDEERRNKLRDSFPKTNGFELRVVEYKTDDKEFNDLMSKLEVELVGLICKKGILSEKAMLLKDGPLPRNVSQEWRYVVGVCKSFRESLKDASTEKLILSLNENQRSNVCYDGDKTFWFLRLRAGDPQSPVKETVRCEVLGKLEEGDSRIDEISAAVLRLKYPVCYGYDDRWRNHLYPVSVTERYCKSQYTSKEMFKLKFGL